MHKLKQTKLKPGLEAF